MWALITGGAKGLGRDITLSLASKGYNVCIHYNKSYFDALETQKKCIQMGVKAEIIQGDFTTDESIDKFMVEYLKKIPDTYILINNVGNYFESNLQDIDKGQWQDVFQTNLNAPFAIIQKLIPDLKKNHGIVINMGVVGLDGLKISKKAPAYFIAKTALMHLTKAFAKELYPFRVKVNMVSLGYLNDSYWQPSERPHFNYTIRSDDVIDVIQFLIKEKNYTITGQNIEIGSFMGL